MPIDVQEFISAASRAVIPGAPNEQSLNSIFQTIIGTISLDKQATFLEMDSLLLTMSTTATPVFTIAAQALDSISRYHALCIRGPTGGSIWKVHVAYPEIPDAILEFRQTVGASESSPLGPATEGSNLLRKVPDPATANTSNYALNGRGYLDVFPRGVLRVYSGADQTTGENFNLQYIRQILSTHARVNAVTGTMIGFEA